MTSRSYSPSTGTPAFIPFFRLHLFRQQRIAAVEHQDKAVEGNCLKV